MLLPKKIDSGCVKDAIIEIKYSSKLPFEVLIGYFFQSIDETYTYSKRAINPNGDIGFQNFNLQIGLQHFFFNDKIKFQLHPNSIVFNCLNSYVLWDEYLAQIKNVVSQIIKIKEIDAFVRVGVRYISEFEKIDFKNSLNFNYSFNQPSILSSTYSFKSEFAIESGFVILQLHNKLRVGTPTADTESFFSQIDIDVVRENLNVSPDSVEELFKIVDDLHTIEKTLFFELLKPDFLKSLNPEY